MSTPRPSVDRKRGGVSALFGALGAALQWRLLLWWVIALAVPTLIAALPLWSALQAQFGLAPQAADIATGRNLPLLLDGMMAMGDSFGGIASGMFVSIAFAVLLSPWLTGMVVASLRAGRRLSMGELAHGGLSEYWRISRMLLWSTVPMGIAIALGGGASAALAHQAEHAILASEASHAADIGFAVLAVLALVAHMTLEAGRGWLGADAALRSVLRAWWRGAKLVVRRPLACLVVYLGTALVGYGLALGLAWLRVRVDGAGPATILIGVLLAQLVVAMIAFAKVARLYGFGALAADAIARHERIAARPPEEPTHLPAADPSAA